MTSRAYWKKRALLLEQMLTNRADGTVAKISALFAEAQATLEREIAGVYDTFQHRGGLTLGEAQRLMGAAQTRDTRAELFSMYQRATGAVKQDLWARLAAPAYSARVTYLQAVQDRAYCQCRMLGLQEAALAEQRLRDTLTQSYYRTIFDIQQYTGEYFDFRLLSDHQLAAALAADWSGENWSDRIWNNNQAFADAVEQTIAVGILSGLSYDQMSAQLLAIIGATPAHGARYNAARLIRTENNYIANQGHLLGYKEAEIGEYTFLATLDLRTTPLCRVLDMKSFPVADAVPGENLPPMHPNCRSTTIPKVTAAELKKRKRAARDPITGKYMSVPADMNYAAWYKKYVEKVDKNGK